MVSAFPILYTICWFTCATDYNNDDDGIWHAVCYLKSMCDILHLTFCCAHRRAAIIGHRACKCLCGMKKNTIPSKSKRCGLVANFIYPFKHHTHLNVVA